MAPILCRELETIEYFEPEEDKDNASGEPDVDGLGVGNRGESLLGLHALGLEG